MIVLLREFADDPTVRLVAALILLDFVTGVAASVKARTFRLGWVSDFLRADVLGKVVPYFAVWGAVRVSGDIEIAGYGVIEVRRASDPRSLHDVGPFQETFPDRPLATTPTTAEAP